MCVSQQMCHGLCVSQHVCVTACVCYSMCVTTCVCACIWKSEGNLLESVLPFHKEIQDLNSGYDISTGVFLLTKPLTPFLLSKRIFKLIIKHMT